MKRLVVMILLAATLPAACGSPYSYVSYEVVRSQDRLAPGDDVRVVPREGEAYRGRLVSIESGLLTVSVSESRERTIAWQDIRVIERIQRVRGR